MRPPRWLAGVATAGVLALGAWAAFAELGTGRGVAAPPAARANAAPETGTPPQPNVATIDDSTEPAAAGQTPMAQRVAVIGLLNKRNGESRDLTMKPGEAFRVGDAIVRLRACEMTAPWEQDQLTGAFVQLDVRGADRRWRRTFSGWTFKERPALNAVQQPVYDVWPKSCTMRFPVSGAETVVEEAPTSRASKARKSPVTSGVPDSSPAAEGPSAGPSNAT